MRPRRRLPPRLPRFAARAIPRLARRALERRAHAADPRIQRLDPRDDFHRRLSGPARLLDGVLLPARGEPLLATRAALGPRPAAERLPAARGQVRALEHDPARACAQARLRPPEPAPLPVPGTRLLRLDVARLDERPGSARVADDLRRADRGRRAVVIPRLLEEHQERPAAGRRRAGARHAIRVRVPAPDRHGLAPGGARLTDLLARGPAH